MNSAVPIRIGDPAPGRRRILHFIESAGMYGAENVIVNLAREMLRHARYQPVIGCIVATGTEHVDLIRLAQSLGIEAHRLVIPNAWVWRDLPLVARQLRRLNIDLIHCHGYKPGVYAFLIGKMARIKVMATCHLWFVEDYAPWKMRAMIRLEKSLYRHFPAVVAVSEQIRSTLLSAGVSPQRLHLVRNGIALDDYACRNAGDSTTDLPGVAADDLVVLNVARLSQQKAQADLVAAAVAVRRIRGDIKFLIVGEGELRGQIERQIAAEGLEDTVQLLGFRSDVGQILRRANLFVLPSLNEGMPVSLLEAVASKVPAVVTNVGDIGKLIEDGVTGRVVEMGNPNALANIILQLLARPQECSALAEAAWHRLHKLYSSSQMYELYARIYAAVTN